MIVFHVVSGPCFFIIGLRGLFFMPNLFDEEVDFFDTFSPLFGYGGEHQQRWREEREAQRAARLRLLKKKDGAALTPEEEAAIAAEASNKLSGSKDASSATAAKPATGCAGRVQAYLRGMSGWQFGYLNAAVFIVVGIAVSNWLGLFMPENVPGTSSLNREIYPSYQA